MSDQVGNSEDRLTRDAAQFFIYDIQKGVISRAYQHIMAKTGFIATSWNGILVRDIFGSRNETKRSRT